MKEFARKLFGGGTSEEKSGERAVAKRGGSEPKVVVFCCSWGALAGGAAPGTLGTNGNVKVIRTVCSGKVDPSFILKAFSSGVDGVLLALCGPGDCHYLSGNYQALRRVELLQKTLDQLGIEPERLGLHWTSASDGAGLESAVKEFTSKVAALGPVK